MSIDFNQLQSTASEQIRAIGRPVKFTRAGVNVASSYAIEKKSEQVDDSRSLLAQTSVTHKTLIVAATQKQLQVGDVMLRGTSLFTVTQVKEVSPAGVVVYLELEVV